MSLINNLFLLFCKMNVKTTTVCHKRVKLQVKLKSLRMEVCCCMRPCVTPSVWDYIPGPRALVSHCALDYSSASILFLSSFFRFPIPCHKNGTHIGQGQGQVYLTIMKPYPNLAHFWFYHTICSYIISSICCRCKYYSPNCTQVTGLQVLWPKRRCRSRQQNR